MKKKLNSLSKKINKFLSKFLKKQKKTELLIPIKYGILPGGKKIRSKILIDVSKIFKIKYQQTLKVCAAVECIHAYSLIHDDLPCMDNDNLRRGKLSTHKKFGESTAILAGNSLLTIAFEILSSRDLNIKDLIKVKLINLLSDCSGHTGIAGGQYLDLDYEHKKVPLRKIIDMETKKTGKLFSFCCLAPVLIAKKKRYFKKFDRIGSNIGLLFQIADDLIDYKGTSKKEGKKTRKDKSKGKATLISLLGYENTVKYANNIKKKIFKELKVFGNKADELKLTIDYIFKRSI